jgi:hypothetical protein
VTTRPPGPTTTTATTTSGNSSGTSSSSVENSFGPLETDERATRDTFLHFLGRLAAKVQR